MALPNKILIKEVGPREGMQFEKGPIPTDKKINLIDRLSECGFQAIEVTSFVSPKWVPQMADAEEVAKRFHKREGVKYNAVYLNAQGLKRAIDTHKFDITGSFINSASELFSQKNTNRSTEDAYRDLRERANLFAAKNIPVTSVSVMAAFGCNYEGDIRIETVMNTIARLIGLATEYGQHIGTITLADTMGWATPKSIQNVVGNVRSKWPDKSIKLHLHDTRGLGISNAYAALEMGVADFDAAVAGLGGCPYGGFNGSAGNIVSEELVHLCEELGIDTGINLDALIEVGRFAEETVGHPLPSKLLRGRPLSSYRHSNSV